MALLFYPAKSMLPPTLLLNSGPYTWNVIGLDSNNVLVGPQDFPVGVRVRNTGAMAATNVTAAFAFTSANTYVNLLNNNTLSTATIAPRRLC